MIKLNEYDFYRFPSVVQSPNYWNIRFNKNHNITMDILHKDDGKKGLFYIEEQGKILAEMTYVWSGPTKLIIDHTGVSELLEGQGVGKQLVRDAVNFAREKRIKILPLCPFAKRVFERTAEYNDVLF